MEEVEGGVVGLEATTYLNQMFYFSYKMVWYLGKNLTTWLTFNFSQLRLNLYLNLLASETKCISRPRYTEESEKMWAEINA